jgi:hypothetical protein
MTEPATSPEVTNRRDALKRLGQASLGLVAALAMGGLAATDAEAKRKESLSNSKKKKKTKGEKKRRKKSEKKKGN